MKKALIALACLLVLAVAGLVAVFLWVRGGLPQRSGEAQISGLNANVQVRYDRWGVPYIRAENQADATAALGWIHANDRFTQMELGRRAAAGRLSEVLGEATIDTDIYFHTLRFGETVQKMWENASPESKATLESYAQGVNAWLESRGGDLPPELRLLGVEPEPWEGLHSLSFALLMARDLSFWNDRPEEERFVWLRHFGADGVRDLLGDPDLHIPDEILAMAGQTSTEEAAPIPSDSEAEVDQDPGPETSPGSNNWAIAPSRAAANRAIIANDPHLGLHLPGVWYQVHIRAPGYEVAGMTLPGTPGVVLGRGAHVAWAFTNTMLDDHDLFFEELDSEGQRVRRGDSWTEITEREVVIKIRGGGERRITLRRTDRGPLLDADPELGLPPRSIAWTAYYESDPVAALNGLAVAKTPEEAFEVIQPFICPAQNLVMAFADGRLAYRVLGGIPERRLGDGRLPSPGWDPAYGWEGLYPREANPTVIDPEDGIIVTANHDIRPPGFELPMTAEFYPGHRAGRIRERLSERENWTFEQIGNLQNDVTSLYATDIVGALGEGYDGKAAEALEALAGWDKAMDANGVSALFALVNRELIRRTFGDEAKALGIAPIGGRDPLLRLLRGEMTLPWFDDVETPETESREEIVAAALEAAWDETHERWGRKKTKWDYAGMHRLTLEHRLDALPFLGPWMRRGPFDVPGSKSTVSAFGARWKGDELDVTFGPSMRWVVDWSHPRMALAALPGGQSGHPADPHYDDQVLRFLDGKLHPAPWGETEINAAAVSQLSLEPK